MSGKATEGQSERRAVQATHIGSAINGVFEQVCKAVEPLPGARLPRGFAGLPTTFMDIDEHMRGLWPGELTAVVGGPCADTGVFVSNVATRVALRGACVLFVSLCSSADEAVLRMLCSQARVRIAKMLRGELQEGEWTALAGASNRLASTNLLVCDDPHLAAEGLRTLATGFLGGAGSALVVVDGISLMAWPWLDPALDWPRIAENAAVALKRLARELDVPVLATLPWAPYSRAVGTGEDVRERAMECLPPVVRTAADTVLHVGTPTAEDAPGGRPSLRISEVTLAKHRFNCPASAKLVYVPSYLCFMDLADDSPEGR